MLRILTDDIPSASVGVPYSFSLQASGAGKEVLLWNIESGGELPDGLKLDATTGLIHGTPLQAARISLYFVVASADSSEHTGKVLTVTVHTTALCITTVELPLGDVRREYCCTLQSQGGHPPYTWTCGRLPKKLFLQQDTIKGRFSDECFCEIDVCVTDKKGAAVHKKLQLTTCRPLTIATDHIACCLYDKEYFFTLESIGGCPPFYWEAKGLGPQMRLVGNTLQGYQNSNGIFSITVTDRFCQSASKDFDFYCLNFYQHLSVHNNFGPIKCNPVSERLAPWVRVAGLPEGLTLVDGMISGTTKYAGFFFLNFYDRDRFLHDMDFCVINKGV